jgi:hypothetical protein
VAEHRRPAAVVGLLLLVTYAYFLSPPSWNENSRFDLVRSLVERRRLDIDPFEHNTGDKSTFGGHTFSDKAPGAAFLASPVYALYYGFRKLSGGPTPSSLPAAGRREEGELPYLVNTAFRRALYVCNLFTNALGGALLGALFFAHLRRRAVAPAAALVATLALGLGSLVLPYATMFYGHVLAALFLFGAFVLVGQGQGQGQSQGETEGEPRRLALAGALGGMAVLTELPTAPAALIIAILAMVTARRRAILYHVAGAAGPLALLLAYQYAAFGAALRPGYALVSRPEFAAGMARGVMGVGLPRPGVLVAELFGRARGLLYLSPVLVLGFVGQGRWLGRTWRDRGERPAAIAACAVTVYFLLMNAGYYMWYGGSALGPRHLIPALPFLCLGIPLASRPLVLAGGLLGLSVVNQLAGTAVGPTAPLLDDVLADHVYRYLLRGAVPSPAGPANLGTLMGLPGVASLLPLLLLWGLAAAVLVPLLWPRAAPAVPP